PAFSPLIPALDIKPIAFDVSSIVKPSEPATGATYLNALPKPVTSVFAFALAAANTSAIRLDSPASKPNADKPSVTISLTAPNSSPLAAAKLIIPSIPSSISDVSQPASDIYLKPSAASDALNLVFAPSSRALSFNWSNSPPVAPLIA